MSRRNTQLLSVGMVIAFLLSGFVCFLECDAGDCGDSESDHCAIHCVCQTVALPAADAPGVLPCLDAREALPQSDVVKSYLVCADIFHPPRA